ncbi:hypothetical protein PR202_gb23884 [Eleusine coracana subsp. coracana]|uniref:Uncharacterized protein n=1 Tax=Eleusine coracana subsp. coracana TaxID=191504 RepID=A0AAV5FKZ8_ELECO|nr:hypothetical protein PR202_gb23884 [Eleusine coracana subsp. coracana]
MQGYDDGLVTAQEVEAKVRLVMESEEGKELKKKVAVAKDKAAAAFKSGGSSEKAFVDFLNGIESSSTLGWNGQGSRAFSRPSLTTHCLSCEVEVAVCPQLDLTSALPDTSVRLDPATQQLVPNLQTFPDILSRGGPSWCAHPPHLASRPSCASNNHSSTLSARLRATEVAVVPAIAAAEHEVATVRLASQVRREAEEHEAAAAREACLMAAQAEAARVAETER